MIRNLTIRDIILDIYAFSDEKVDQTYRCNIYCTFGHMGFFVSSDNGCFFMFHLL